MSNRIYEEGGGDSAEFIAYRLHGLCKVGAAASDTVLNIDLQKGGYTDLFETMAGLCDELIEAMNAETKEETSAGV